MVGTLLLLAGLQAPTDTITVTTAEAFALAMEVSPEVFAADLRATAAQERAFQADAWPNPSLSISAENLGQQRALTGLAGLEGTEGQAVVSLPLPIGWERAGTRASARAMASLQDASARIAKQDAGVQVLSVIGEVLRDQILVENAREEEASLGRFAEVLRLQAQEGRASAGDAARAELARGLASTRLARRQTSLAISATDLARRLGYAAETTVVLDASTCVRPPGSVTSRDAAPAFPEADRAAAAVDLASANITLATGLRIPDFTPQVGVRRAGGLSAFFLGVATTLPLFDRGDRRMVAARAEHDAASADARAVDASLAASRVAARRTTEALERAGRGFSATWFEALDRTVVAAQARYDLGEGSLFELLDSRRARLEALDDYAIWQAEWWQARGALARLEGREPTPEALCIDPFRRN